MYVKKLPLLILILITATLATTMAYAKSAEDYFNSGVAKYNQGDYSGAIADFTEAIRMDVDAYDNRGNAKDDMGDHSANYPSFEQMEYQVFMQLYKEALSKNTLIHISLSQPEGWKQGDDDLYSLRDFPFVESTQDYVAFSHPTSRSTIFVSYKPILGRSYFLGDPKKLAEWYKEAQLKKYKESEEEVTEGPIEIHTKEIGGRPFYVIQHEKSTYLKERRIVYIFLHIPEDIKSLYTFCFSTTSKEGIEKSKPFQDFIKMVSGFKTNRLDAYEEILYRVEQKLWMSIPVADVKWFNAIQNESIEELKNAVALKPEAWEPHYLLAEIYSSSYLLTEDDEKLLSGEERKAAKWWINIGGKMVPSSPYRINANAAVEEYKKVIRLTPPQEMVEDIYIWLAQILIELKRYDDAISYCEECIKRVQKKRKAFSCQSSLLDAYLQKARQNYKQKNYDVAIESYKKAIVIDTIWGEVLWEEIAEVYEKKGMEKEAIEAYSKILEILKGKKKDSRDKTSIERYEKSEKEIEKKLKELQRQ